VRVTGVSINIMFPTEGSCLWSGEYSLYITTWCCECNCVLDKFVLFLLFGLLLRVEIEYLELRAERSTLDGG